MQARFYHLSVVFIWCLTATSLHFFFFFFRKGKVPDVLIATIEPPTGMNVTGRGCLIQARLCRPKRAESRGDQQAKEVSDGKLLY
jgi:hypothetical protein